MKLFADTARRSVSAATAALFVWFTTIGCLACCVGMPNAFAASAIDAPELPSAPAATVAASGEHACCVEAEKAAIETAPRDEAHDAAGASGGTTESASPAVPVRAASPASAPCHQGGECPFLTSSTGFGVAPQREAKAPTVALVESTELPFAAFASAPDPPVEPPPYVASRGDTYLRCCVFLI